ncbi:MAG: translocation/assembly module TamB domain-containing protein [Cytophagales bacterium]|nr:translocation/assembly module TamB domain-containing protein [Cytophagales bacterium]
MASSKTYPQTYGKVVKKTSLSRNRIPRSYFFLGISLLMGILIAIFFPKFQNIIQIRALQEILKYKEHLSFQKLNIRNIQHLEIQNIEYIHPELNIIIYAESIKISAKLWTLLWSHRVQPQSLKISCAQVHFPYGGQKTPDISKIPWKEIREDLWKKRKELKINREIHLPKLYLEDIHLIPHPETSKNPSKSETASSYPILKQTHFQDLWINDQFISLQKGNMNLNNPDLDLQISFFRWEKEKMYVPHLSVYSPQDTLEARLILFSAPHPTMVQLNLAASHFNIQSLKAFLPSIPDPEKTVHLKGAIRIDHDMTELNLQELNWGNTKIKDLSLCYENLRNFQVEVERFFLSEEHLKFGLQLIAQTQIDKNYLQTLNGLKKLKLYGLLSRNENQYMWHANLYESQGNLKTQGILDTQNKTYRVHMSAKNFQAPKLFPKYSLHQLSFSAHLRGQGFTPKTFQLKGEISVKHARYLQKDWENWKAIVELSPQKNMLNLFVEDPHFQGTAYCQWQLLPHKIDSENEYQIQAHWDLEHMNLSTILPNTLPIEWEGQGHANLHIHPRKYLSGEIQVSSSQLKLGERSIDLDVFSLRGKKISPGKYELSLQESKSQLIYKYSALVPSLNQLKKDLMDMRKTISPEPVNSSETYEIDMLIPTSDLQRYTSFFLPQIQFSSKSHLSLQAQRNLQQGKYTIEAHTDRIRIENHVFLKPQLKFQTQFSHIQEQEGYLSLQIQEHDAQILKFKNPFLSLNWKGCEGQFQLGIEDNTSYSFARVNGNISYNSEQDWTIFLKPSELQVLGEPWRFQEGNLFILSDEGIHVHDFELSTPSGDQNIKIWGGNIGHPSPLMLQVGNFDLGNLNPLLPDKRFQISGRLNALLAIQYPWPVHRNFEAEVLLKDFTLGDIEIGNLILKSSINQEYGISTLKLYENETLSLFGEHKMFLQHDPPLAEGLIKLEGTNFQILEIFMKIFADQLKGELHGKVQIQGPLFQPNLSGKLKLKKGQGRLIYYNSIYQIPHGKAQFVNNKFEIQEIHLIDDMGQKALLKGEMWMEKQHLKMDIHLEAKELHLINLSEKDYQELRERGLYGQGYASGKVRFLGSFPGEVNMTGQVKVEDKTQIFIPLDLGTISSSAAHSAVSFATLLSDKSSKDGALSTKNTNPYPQSFSANINIDFEDNAQCKVLLSIPFPGEITAYGVGQLKFVVEQEKLSIFGQVILNKGTYEMHPNVFVNREATLIPGGKIVWNGPIEEGILDAQLKYSQYASIRPLLSGAEQFLLERKDRYMVETQIHLKHIISNPRLSIDISIPDYPIGVGTLFGNPEEKQRQAINLIFLGQFSAPQQVGLNLRAVESSLNEVISEQLENWIAQWDQNLSLRVDMGNLTQEDQRRFRLSLSRSFWDGRFQVSRDIDFSRIQAPVQFWAGNWELEYALAKSRQLRLKIYLNTLSEDLVYQNLFQTGVSLRYVSEFDHILPFAQNSENSSDPPDLNN